MISELKCTFRFDIDNVRFRRERRLAVLPHAEACRGRNVPRRMAV